jgi:hypothetical protein
VTKTGIFETPIFFVKDAAQAGGGYRSPVVDQAVGKLIALEARQCRAELQRLAARLAAYEQQYQMASDDFYQRFRKGELGDDMDFVEWSIFWDMRQATEKRLASLLKQAS